MRKFFVLLMLVGLTACEVDQATADRVLGDEGYHDVELQGYSMWGCSDDDTFKSRFRAKRTVIEPDGSSYARVVTGSLCCGVLKDCTVRH